MQTEVNHGTKPRASKSIDANGDFRNILIIRLSAMGDVAFALPALEVLRAHHPHARISWAVEDRVAPILEGHPLIDELIVLPRREWRAMKKEPGGTTRMIGSMRRFFRDLRRKRFDVSIDFQGNLKSGLVTHFARAPLRLGLGRDECSEPNWLFTNRRLKMNGRVVHRIERDLLMLTLLDIPFEFRWPVFNHAEKDREPVDAFLVDLPRPWHVFHPGTSAWAPHKRWPTGHYAGLGDALLDRLGGSVILSWGPGEENLVEEIGEAMKGDAIAAPSTLDLRQASYLVSRADLVVGSDTGPTHLASLQQVNTVTLFGPYDPRLYYPYQHPERAHFARIPCAPCRHRGCTTRDCMELITVEQVLETCESIYGNREIRPPLLTPHKTVQV